MLATKETVYTKDAANKKMFVVREFDASPEKVWRAWTESDWLDQWWAPKPWKAITQSMDFREGGTWFYYMQGPDNSRHYCRVDYTSIIPGKSFSGNDSFCDENGNILTEFPSMGWEISFNAAGDATRVNAGITFKSEEDMEKIIEMGFKEGFAAAHGNLDEVLAGS
jgi:uncharacterized protein YndB with AHSA1/START domain